MCYLMLTICCRDKRALHPIFCRLHGLADRYRYCRCVVGPSLQPGIVKTVDKIWCHHSLYALLYRFFKQLLFQHSKPFSFLEDPGWFLGQDDKQCFSVVQWSARPSRTVAREVRRAHSTDKWQHYRALSTKTHSTKSHTRGKEGWTSLCSPTSATELCSRYPCPWRWISSINP